MTVTTIKDRIAKAEERIAKKQNTIEKKKGWIEKKTIALDKMNDQDRRWAESDIHWWNEDIERATREIDEIKKTIENYKKQLDGATEKEKILKTIPDSMKKMQTDLVDGWDNYDKNKKTELKKIYSDIEKIKDYKERQKEKRIFIRKYSMTGYDLMFKSDNDIHKDNMKVAEKLIIDLYYRIKNITGDVTNWQDIRATQGANGFAVLNGIVTGKQGTCRVESIEAGGYNIQRYHIRVLTHEINY